MNAERYQLMLENEFFPAAQASGQIDGFWFQQDGAAPHRTVDVKNSIRNVFGDRITGLGFPFEEGDEISWPS